MRTCWARFTNTCDNCWTIATATYTNSFRSFMHIREVCMCSYGWMGRLSIHVLLFHIHITQLLQKYSCYFMQYLRQAASVSGKQSLAVVDRPKKLSESLPSASTSCLKQADSEEAGGVNQLLPCKEDTEPYIPIMMVSTCQMKHYVWRTCTSHFVLKLYNATCMWIVQNTHATHIGSFCCVCCVALYTPPCIRIALDGVIH